MRGGLGDGVRKAAEDGNRVTAPGPAKDSNDQRADGAAKGDATGLGGAIQVRGPQEEAASPVDVRVHGGGHVIEPSYMTWSQAAGKMEVAAKLERLPEGVEFPEGFPEPIKWDAERKELMYRGFMTAMSFEFLRQLSTDLLYLAALNSVNIQSSGAIMGKPPARRGWVWWVAALAAAGAGAAIWLARR